MICTSEINTITIITVLGIIIYILLSNKGKQETEYNNKLKLLDQMISESKKTIANKIDQKQQKLKEGLPREYASVETNYIPPTPSSQPVQQDQPVQQIQPVQNPIYLPSMIPQMLPLSDPVINRDRAVIFDQLYPPLGRVERPIFDQLAARVASGLMAYPTRGSPDTFRMVGYMVNSENKNDSWKLFGRQKYPGSSIGEYYAIPFDDRRADMKITIKERIIAYLYTVAKIPYQYFFKNHKPSVNPLIQNRFFRKRVCHGQPWPLTDPRCSCRWCEIVYVGHQFQLSCARKSKLGLRPLWQCHTFNRPYRRQVGWHHELS